MKRREFFHSASAAIVGDTGRVVAVGDADAVAAALRDTLALPADERARLGERARDRIVARYSIDGVASQYLALYRELARVT